MQVKKQSLCCRRAVVVEVEVVLMLAGVVDINSGSSTDTTGFVRHCIVGLLAGSSPYHRLYFVPV